jgi:hypothetical protein
LRIKPPWGEVKSLLIEYKVERHRFYFPTTLLANGDFSIGLSEKTTIKARLRYNSNGELHIPAHFTIGLMIYRTFLELEKGDRSLKDFIIYDDRPGT